MKLTTQRAVAGRMVALVYNGFMTHIPSRAGRNCFLRLWLGSCGSGTGVQMGTRFLNARKVHFGCRNAINFGCLFDGRVHDIRTGCDVSIGPEATILTLGHDPHSQDFADEGGPVAIGDKVWIGYRALVLPNLTIGDGAVVGAGAVVTKDVPPFTIVAGNPARQIGERPRELTYTLSHTPWLG